MTTNRVAATDAVLDEGPEVTDEDIGAVGVAAVSTPRPRPGPGRSWWSAMQNYAALITEATPMRALPLPLTQNEPAAAACRLSELPHNVAAVLLIGLDPSGAAHVQRAAAAAGGPPVISELDVVTAALGAAAVSFLRGRDIAPRRGRIVVTGAEVVPRLGPLLKASGAGSMTTWHPFDAQDYPLPRMMAHNDLLIDLADAAPDNAAPARTLRMPSEPHDYGALVIPGLLRGLCRHEPTPVTIEVLAACSRALALVTAPDAILPDIDERLLIPAVARHVHRSLREDSRHRALAHRQPSRQPSPAHDTDHGGQPQ